VFLLLPYFYHDAATHHALHILDAPGVISNSVCRIVGYTVNRWCDAILAFCHKFR